MIKQVKKPSGLEFQWGSVVVNVIFDRESDGRQSAMVIVTSQALPDERQVKIKTKRYSDGAVITAKPNEKLPKGRPADPMPEGLEIEGELCGRNVILDPKYYPGDLISRVVRCTGGFGCNADGHTRKLFGVHLATKKEFAGRRESAKRFATMSETAEAMRRGEQVAE